MSFNFENEYVLPFNGSYLGSYRFLQVIPWFCPVQENTIRNKIPVLMVFLTIENIRIPVFLKKSYNKGIDQCLIDELKPIFGLKKMGTHRITLDMIPEKKTNGPWIDKDLNINIVLRQKKTEYLICRADTRICEDNSRQFIMHKNIIDYEWIQTNPDKNYGLNQYIYFEIQKIFFFKELFRLSNNDADNILIKENLNEVPIIFSISDKRIINLDTDKIPQLGTEIDKFFFPKLNSRHKLLASIFELSETNFQGRLCKLKDECYKIIDRFDQNKIWIVDYVFKKLYDMCDIYFLKKKTFEV